MIERTEPISTSTVELNRMWDTPTPSNVDKAYWQTLEDNGWLVEGNWMDGDHFIETCERGRFKVMTRSIAIRWIEDGQEAAKTYFRPIEAIPLDPLPRKEAI